MSGNLMVTVIRKISRKAVKNVEIEKNTERKKSSIELKGKIDWQKESIQGMKTHKEDIEMIQWVELIERKRQRVSEMNINVQKEI